ncbi:PL29 family lyase N-terminal domain-containing protein [Bacteroides ovatus]|uniref:DUF4988 domain-containing protein n=1 Tax=Bacteroides ovatus TaxID=28116 RepID=A0A1G8D2B6_BACOV|nr:PL29 family lyase N-terminal domain-containing protein [Bacteroides ovatus]SDH51663.1 protein of unknown function [Bacteroides ovatus]
MKKVWSMFMLLAVCLVACTNIDDLEDDVDALKKRVTALETQVRDINSNTEALRELYNEGTFITNIEEKSDSYTLTLSNGKTVNLYMKNDNNLLCPIIGIDSEGYWTVLYNKNETPERLTVNGQPVKANGESGKTPTFNVDSEGYWQVSYDGGKNYSYIYKEGTTDKVSATGDGSAPTEDKNFKSVTVENNELVLVLAGEDAPTIRIPIVRDFECSFAAEDLKQVQEFSAGEVKEFTMTVRGVENTMITAPEGWSAKFSKEAGKENVLVVTAPASSAKMMTRATADNSTDIAVLATSGKYAMITKIQVKVIDTPQSKDFYTEYNTNGNITIGNVSITKGANEAILLDGSDESASNIRNLIHQKTEQTVIFLEKGAYDFNTPSIAEITGTVVIIGRYSDSKPILKPELLWKLKSGKLIFKNIQLDLTKIDASGGNNKYMFCNADATADFEDFVLEDCEITNIQKNFYYNNVAAYTIKNIYAKNSRFQLNTTADGVLIFNIYNTTHLDAMQMFTFENNIVYNKTSVIGQILSWNNNTVQSPDQQQIEVSFCNNTIVNYVGKNYHLKFYDTKKITISKNIFYADPNMSSDATMCGIYKKESTPEFDVKDNIAYGLTETNKWNSFGATVKPTNPIEEQLLRLTNSPFTSMDLDKGIFIPDNAYTGFGSTINQ